MFQAYGDREESIIDEEIFTKYKVKYQKMAAPEVNEVDYSLEQSFDEV